MQSTGPVRYIERTRAYYQALGYPSPYRWARLDSVPFSALAKPLARSRVALVSTAAPVRAGIGDQGPGAAYNGAAKLRRVGSVPIEPPPELRISHLTYDRDHTAAEDIASYLPLERLREAQANGRIGGLAEEVLLLPSARSQSATTQRDAPEIERRARAGHADVVLLVPV